MRLKHRQRPSLLAYALLGLISTACGGGGGGEFVPPGGVPPVLEFSGVNATVAEAQGTFTVRLVLSSASSQDITVQLGLSGTATAADYFVASTNLTIPAGNTLASLPIQLFPDFEPEDTETIVLTIESADGATLGTSLQFLIQVLPDAVEAEPNNDVTRANTIGAVGPGAFRQVTGHVSAVAAGLDDEFDVYRFNATQDTLLRVQVFPEANDANVDAWVTRPAGKVIGLFGASNPGSREEGYIEVDQGDEFLVVVLTRGQDTSYSLQVSGLPPLE